MQVPLLVASHSTVREKKDWLSGVHESAPARLGRVLCSQIGPEGKAGTLETYSPMSRQHSLRV